MPHFQSIKSLVFEEFYVILFLMQYFDGSYHFIMAIIIIVHWISELVMSWFLFLQMFLVSLVVTR